MGIQLFFVFAPDGNPTFFAFSTPREFNLFFSFQVEFPWGAKRKNVGFSWGAKREQHVGFPWGARKRKVGFPWGAEKKKVEFPLGAKRKKMLDSHRVRKEKNSWIPIGCQKKKNKKSWIPMGCQKKRFDCHGVRKKKVQLPWGAKKMDSHWVRKEKKKKSWIPMGCQLDSHGVLKVAPHGN